MFYGNQSANTQKYFALFHLLVTNLYGIIEQSFKKFRNQDFLKTVIKAISIIKKTSELENYSTLSSTTCQLAIKPAPFTERSLLNTTVNRLPVDKIGGGSNAPQNLKKKKFEWERKLI